jgi:hypothetical protein
MASSVLISIPENLNFLNQNKYEKKIEKEDLKCLCDICNGYATVINLYNYNPLQLRICQKKSKSKLSSYKIETQFNYTNYPNYSISNLEELSLKSINPNPLALPLTLPSTLPSTLNEEKEVSKLTSSNLTSSPLSLTSNSSFSSFRSSPDLFQELLCLGCGHVEYCECFSEQNDISIIPKKLEEKQEKEEKSKFLPINMSKKYYEFSYDDYDYDYVEKKDCDCNLICYDYKCDCHFYEV